MPVPGRNEVKKKFIGRCVPIVLNEGTTKDPKQAAAICYSIWKQHHKNAKASDLLTEVAKNLPEASGFIPNNNLDKQG